jgi:hypothetical protein
LIVSLYERLRSCEAALRTHLDDGEQVVATGRCEDVTDRGGPERGSSGGTFVMITNTKLRWVPGVHLAFEAALELRDVTAFAERTQSHRYSIALKHPPLTRLHTVPAHRLLWFAWGDVFANDPFTRTELAFSRRNTKAAQALRTALGIVHPISPVQDDAPRDRYLHRGTYFEDRRGTVAGLRGRWRRRFAGARLGRRAD